MFVAGLGPDTCARCFCGLVEDDLTFEYTTEENIKATFCYECGLIEQSHSSGEPIESVEARWRKHFNLDERFKETTNENIQS